MGKKRDDLKPVDIETLATLMRRSIYNAYCATLIGTPVLVTKRYSERARSPQVGDLVIESSTVFGMRHDNASDLDGIGILEEIAREKVVWGDPDFVWDEDIEGQPHPTERIYYIRTFDGRRFRWENATMIAAVSGIHDVNLPWPNPVSSSASSSA